MKPLLLVDHSKYEMVQIRVKFVLCEMVLYLHDYILMHDICIIWFGDYISSTQPICELLYMYIV